MRDKYSLIANWKLLSIFGVVLLGLYLLLTPLLSYAQKNEIGNFVLIPDRELDTSEIQQLLVLSDYVVDKSQRNSRMSAILKLGEVFGHKYAIPALLAVLRDPSDDPHLRSLSITALSNIADERVIDHLIDALSFENKQLAFRAWQQLSKIITPSPKFDPNAEYSARRVYAGRWREWWNSNRGRVELHWDMAKVDFHYN